MPLNAEQQAAIDLMAEHCRTVGNSPFFVLEGPAGTGKTFTLKTLIQEFKRRTVFTAPTNKAVRVLRETLRADDYKPEARTIYSLLGLQMLPNGEVKELAKPDDPVDLSEFALVVVDEASMINKALMGYIKEAAATHPRIRWIFMGDPFQLPPVGETDSEVWELPNGAQLHQIMRQDNQILTLSQHLRNMVQKPFGALKLVNDNDGEEGVWSLAGGRLDQAMLNHADTFLKGESKAIAWRNVEVDRLNAIIRRELFKETEAYPWQPGDRVTLLEPARNLDGDPMGTTDEEGAVDKADMAEHPTHKEFECWRINMISDFNSALCLWVPTTKGKLKLAQRLTRLAAEARASRDWKPYWALKESFHAVRHAYAITAHRAQGSTYTRAFVSWRDILLNRQRGEAMRCLYVACTRPRKELYVG
jgi:ATP-dependent exoDNAse (exonuclease V) alpha subunit